MGEAVCIHSEETPPFLASKPAYLECLSGASAEISGIAVKSGDWCGDNCGLRVHLLKLWQV